MNTASSLDPINRSELVTDHSGDTNKMVVREATKRIRDSGFAATRNPLWQTNFYSGYTSAILRAAADEMYFVADRDLLRAIASRIDTGDLEGSEQ